MQSLYGSWLCGLPRLRSKVAPSRSQVHELLVLEQFPSPLVRRVTAQPLRAGQASLSLVATVVHGSLIGLDATRRLTIPAGALQAGHAAGVPTAAGAAAHSSARETGAPHLAGGACAAADAAAPGSPAGGGGGSPDRAQEVAAIVSAAEAGQGAGGPAGPGPDGSCRTQPPIAPPAAVNAAVGCAPRGQPPALGSAAWHAAGSPAGAAERAQVGTPLGFFFPLRLRQACW